MSRGSFFLAVALVGTTNFLGGPGFVFAENNPTNELQLALDRLDQFVGLGENGQNWRTFLHSDELRAELAKPSMGNREKLQTILTLYSGSQNGLELAPFQQVRQALQKCVSDSSDTKPSLASDVKLAVAISGPEKVKLASVSVPVSGSISTTPISIPMSGAAYSAQAAVRRELGGFDQYVGYGPNGKAWRDYLGIDGLLKQLQPGLSPDIKTLSEIRDNFRHDEDGLESLPMARLEIALTKYIRQLGPSVVTPAPGRPNFYVGASYSVVAAGITTSQHIDRTEPIVDDILGTHIVGSGRTVANTQLRFVPNYSRATFETVLTGNNYSTTTGHHDPISICSTGVTTLSGTKQAQMDGSGLIGLPAHAQASTHSSVNSLTVNRNHFVRIIERGAWKRIGQSKGESEAVASQHAQQRLQSRMDQEGNERIPKLNAQYQHNDFRTNLEAHDTYPSQLNFATPTSDLLTIIAREAAEDQSGAPNDPGNFANPGALSTRIHESTINNFLAKRLSGREVTASVPKTFREQTAEEKDEEYAMQKSIAARHYLSFEQKQIQLKQDKLRMQTVFITEPNDKPAKSATDASGDQEGTKKIEREMKYTYHAEKNPIHVKFRNGDVRVTFNLAAVTIDGEFAGEWQIAALYHLGFDNGNLVMELKDVNANPDPEDPSQKVTPAKVAEKSSDDDAKDDNAKPDKTAKSSAQLLSSNCITVPNGWSNNKVFLIGRSLRRAFGDQLRPIYRLRYVALPGEWVKAGQMKVQEAFCQDGWLGLAFQQTGIPVESDIISKRAMLKNSQAR